jgi:hypothetical protein
MSANVLCAHIVRQKSHALFVYFALCRVVADWVHNLLFTPHLLGIDYSTRTASSSEECARLTQVNQSQQSREDDYYCMKNWTMMTQFI